MAVPEDLICPDCGGEVGGTGADGVKPCSCFAEDRRHNDRVAHAHAHPADAHSAAELRQAVAVAGIRPVDLGDSDDDAADDGLAPSPGGSGLSDGDLSDSAPSDGPAAEDGRSSRRGKADKPPKPCHLCGKDLRGKRRFKDARGYTCVECDRIEQGTHAERGMCAECRRVVKRDTLRAYGAVKVCRQCYADHQNDPRRDLRKIGTEAFRWEEYRRLIALAAVGGVLLLIMLLAQLGVI